MKIKKLFVLFGTFVIALAVLTFGSMWSGVSAAGADGLVALINSVDGLTATISGFNEITVTGAANIGRTRLNLEIDPGVSVKWMADVTGAATANNYALGLSGGGVFELSDATLTNTGAGGTLYIDGGITLNIDALGLIDSPTTGTGSAVTIAGDVQNTEINVGNGGKIRSVPGGYAINDGSGFTQSENNTKININQDGVVEAGNAGAIRSTGKFSVVRVNAGGLVTSSPTSNVSPVISMNCDPPPDFPIDNVIVDGGTVRTTNSGNVSYVIQTSQSVVVNSGGLVQSIAGRGINLVGMDSTATINGGEVTTVSGVAVSVATTTLGKVVNAKVVVNGGKVEATGSGTAIHITDTANTVSISGGQVLAKSGYAIDVEARVSGTAVDVSGGFVFAWGGGIGDVISRESTKLNRPVGGVVAAWDTTTGVGIAPYYQGESDDLVFTPAESDVHWELNPDSFAPYDGIGYNGSEFFGLNVNVIQSWFTLTIYNGSGTREVRSVKAKTVESIVAEPGEPINDTLAPPYNYPVNGTVFDKWESNNGGDFDDENALATEFTMPENDVTITAMYNLRYLLHIIGGTIDIGDRNYGGSASYGYYTQGEIINITGNSSFENWETTRGGSFADENAQFTTFTMPGNETMIQAIQGTYTKPEPTEKYTAEIVNGSGLFTGTATEILSDTSYTGYSGTGLHISAREAASDEVFAHWEVTDGGSGFFENPFDPDTVFIMLGNAKIEAVFDNVYQVPESEIRYEVWAWNGTPAASDYAEGDTVTISANAPESGMKFDLWVIAYGDVVIADITSETITFVMPADDVILMATYTEVVSEIVTPPPPPPYVNPTTQPPTTSSEPTSDSTEPTTTETTTTTEITETTTEEETTTTEEESSTEITTTEESITETTTDEDEDEPEPTTTQEQPTTEPTIDEPNEKRYGEDTTETTTPKEPRAEPTTEVATDISKDPEKIDKTEETETIPEPPYTEIAQTTPSPTEPLMSAPKLPEAGAAVTITTPAGEIFEFEYREEMPNIVSPLPNGWFAAAVGEYEHIWEIFDENKQTIGFVWFDGDDIEKWEDHGDMILLDAALQREKREGPGSTQLPSDETETSNSDEAEQPQEQQDKDNPKTGDIVLLAIILTLVALFSVIVAVKVKKQKTGC